MVGSSLALSTPRTAATSSLSPGPCASVGVPVSPQLGKAGASLATSRSANRSAVRCHHHDPSLTHAPCTKTTLIRSSWSRSGTQSNRWLGIQFPPCDVRGGTYHLAMAPTREAEELLL